jgi:hypothetical protein
MQATGHNFYNQAHANKRAVEVALDALRKIRLGHPCDVPEAIAKYAVEEIEEIINLGDHQSMTQTDMNNVASQLRRAAEALKGQTP